MRKRRNKQREQGESLSSSSLSFHHILLKTAFSARFLLFCPDIYAVPMTTVCVPLLYIRHHVVPMYVRRTLNLVVFQPSLCGTTIGMLRVKLGCGGKMRARYGMHGDNGRQSKNCTLTHTTIVHNALSLGTSRQTAMANLERTHTIHTPLHTCTSISHRNTHVHPHTWNVATYAQTQMESMTNKVYLPRNSLTVILSSKSATNAMCFSCNAARGANSVSISDAAIPTDGSREHSSRRGVCRQTWGEHTGMSSHTANGFGF